MQAVRLHDGRVHLQDGPIDLILKAEGPDRAAAETAAIDAFDGLLTELVGELPILRRPIVDPPTAVSGPVARRMVAAVAPWPDRFVTPMAAVAGAVADHILACMLEAAPDLSRAWVNDGGDIAFHLAPEQSFDVGLVADLQAPALAGTATLRHTDPVRGVATSGRGGRSFSFGIADAVTVLARDAASADVAATLIGNAVDLPGHPAIRRGPASAEDPDSDLGDRPVVLDVGALAPGEIDAALDAGLLAYETITKSMPVNAVVLFLAGRWRIAGETVPAARVRWSDGT
ncbi:UPF0280 family protein [Thalassobaculum litoreum]|uniref:Uncharacterized protein n=1 Tax=Thalassobaculum litoreum DSM 18839 TaxID=1123362 RepID=A0A8G2BLF1_9PROT|nr:UPF0280 family protein [Thalassobaculum litoreum]SDG31551.1 hypothetical protein SAMN05660686_04004 [Thalassobaculum litoreum DSM 18839]